MKKIFILNFICLSLIGCKNSPQPSNNNNEMPEALQENSSPIRSLSKNRSNDMVEDLYKELSAKTPDLKALEINISNLNESKDDSTKSFNEYNNKIQSYFNSANTHIEQIKDSSLREKIKVLVLNSLADYNTSISAHLKLLAGITEKTMALNDLHTILKITRTLPVLVQYEVKNKPSTWPLEGLKKEIDNTLLLEDNLIKK